MTRIPVPRVRRTIAWVDEFGHQDCFIDMEHVPGCTLDTCWSSLSVFSQFRVIATLRPYICQMRHIKYTSPPKLGPIGESSQLCRGNMFSEFGSGPFPDYESFRTYSLMWLPHNVPHLLPLVFTL